MPNLATLVFEARERAPGARRVRPAQSVVGSARLE